MFPPITIKSPNEYHHSTNANPNEQFLEGIIAPPIIPVTRRRSTCEIDTIFSRNNALATSHEITEVRPINLGRTGSGTSSLIGEAPTVSATSNGKSTEKNNSASSQANLNRIRAFIEVN